jgi:hypothetical protein
MELGRLMGEIERGTHAGDVLELVGDVVLLAEIGRFSESFGDTAEMYVADAVRRFVARADDESWLALMTAIDRSAEPHRAALQHMVRWSLAEDRATEVARFAEPPACSCGGRGGACHAGP